MIPEKFQQLGIRMEFIGDDIHIPAQEMYTVNKYLDGAILTVYDHPYQDTPDLLSIIIVTAIHVKTAVYSFTRKCLKAGCSLLIN